MIHPDTELRFINDQIGSGVFATAPVPKGTIVYIKDELEVIIPWHSDLINHPGYQKAIEHFSYTEPDGTRVISWDIAKYVNHSCNSNTLSTGYGFEIAVRDIEPDEQITDDYGALNIENSMQCHCGHHGCRTHITPDDIMNYTGQWDPILQSALSRLHYVEQPLMQLMDHQTRIQLQDYITDPSAYRSIALLRYEKDKTDISMTDILLHNNEQITSLEY